MSIEVFRLSFGFSVNSFHHFLSSSERQLSHSKKVTVPKILAVQGSSVDIFCNITPPISEDRVRLVLFFINNTSIPIYTINANEETGLKNTHWSHERILGGRAFFRGEPEPSRLILDNIQSSDSGEYRCRVDFYKSPTSITNVFLDVIIPPEKPRVYDDRGQEILESVGPFKIGTSLHLTCISKGGHPSPSLTWSKDHVIIDESFQVHEDQSASNDLSLHNLQRSDLASLLSCVSSNTNLSVPISTHLRIDMTFGPLEVKLIGRREPISGGRPVEFRCQSVGARPPAVISWWKGVTQLRDNITSRTSPDGNVTLSTLHYVPSIRDASKFMACKAENPDLPLESLEEGWKLEIHYIPQSVLNLGLNLNGSNIKEGDDVYFECIVRANPKPYKISWRFNENPLVDHHQSGIIVSNHSLVLQKVSKFQSGIYTCVAHNTEGDGVSNPMTLNVRYAPFCKESQRVVFAGSKEETFDLICDVISNPSAGLTFDWKFNNSYEILDIPIHNNNQGNSGVFGTRSHLSYTLRSDFDYGNIFCWGSNGIGKQGIPCIFTIVHAGRPEPPVNCSLVSSSLYAIRVLCSTGSDGGLPTTFVCEVRNSLNYNVVAKIQSNFPSFNISDLRPGHSYSLKIYSINSKGISSSIRLYGFTAVLQEEKLLENDVASNTAQDFSLTTIFGILVSSGAGLALLAVAFLVFIACKPKKFKQSTNSRLISHPNHFLLHDMRLKEDFDDREPDVILVTKNSLPSQRPYSTLGRPPRNFEDIDKQQIGLKNNRFSRLSQEVTYGNFTLPRKGGYSPMIPCVGSQLGSGTYSLENESFSLQSPLVSFPS